MRFIFRNKLSHVSGGAEGKATLPSFAGPWPELWMSWVRKTLHKSKNENCQTPGEVFRLGVDFVLPLSQEEQQQQEEPLTKIYQKGEC